ncbi:MAG: NUDIX hydrolase [Candidatus Marinimicrobia bacterium]|nr:NUDIX hydrolase [Candidatus Neomarinimicrobiota bacterium]
MAHLEFCSNCGKKNLFSNRDGRDRYHCPDCGTIHYENPKPTATLICPKGDDILLVKRAFEPAKRYWSLPGGFVELNETIEGAAQRELKEETMLDGTVTDILGHCSHFNTVFGDVLLVGLVMEIKDYSQIIPGDDAMDAQFFPLKGLPQLAFYCHEEIVRKYLEWVQKKSAKGHS